MSSKSRQLRHRRYDLGDVRVARVLSQSDEHVVLEVRRDQKNKKIKLREGDEFYTIIFTERDPWGDPVGHDVDPVGKN